MEWYYVPLDALIAPLKPVHVASMAMFLKHLARNACHVGLAALLVMLMILLFVPAALMALL